MKSWPAPSRPQLPGTGPQVCLHDTATGGLRPTSPGPTARMYVCGITPYDAAHLGHAATYVAFDLLHRAWLDAGHEVDYVQNVTDVDDPLLERANETGVDWRDLAESQTTIFRDDMSALAALPPTSFVAVTEVMAEITALLRRLADAGASYQVPVTDGTAVEPGAADTYFDVTVDPTFGCVSGLGADEMATLSAERGGDPDRPGKRNPLDPLLWRAARAGEPAWSGDGVPAGRPGWHVECVAIALRDLGAGFDVQGGGSDLAFPHHEMGASHSHAVGARPFAQLYAHAGMVGLDGEKMSKSKGNLVFVHRLVEQGTPAPVVRLALLAHHYRSDWAFDDEVLTEAATRFARWRDAVSREGGPDATAVLAEVRRALADDLDAPRALSAVDDWCAEQERSGGDDPGAPGLVARLADALLGVRL